MADTIVRGADLHRQSEQAQAAVLSKTVHHTRLPQTPRVLPAVPLIRPTVPIDVSASARLRPFTQTKRRKEDQNVSSDSVDASLISAAVPWHKRLRTLPPRPTRQSLAAAARADDAMRGLNDCVWTTPGAAAADQSFDPASVVDVMDLVDVMTCVMDRPPPPRPVGLILLIKFISY